MAELKTKKTAQSVEQFLNAISDENRRADCYKIMEMMRRATGAEPRMWGDAIVGFGDYHYKYASGREGDWFRVGFAPRKNDLTLYLGYDVLQFASSMEKLGKYKTGKGCLYIKKLSDVDVDTLQTVIDQAAGRML